MTEKKKRVMNPNSLANLVPLKKGDPRTLAIVKKSNESPKRRGRRLILDTLTAYLERTNGKTDKRAVDRIFGEVLLQIAAKGNVKAIDTVARIYGLGGGKSDDDDEEEREEQGAPVTAGGETIAKIRAWLDWQLLSGANTAFLFGTTRSGKTYAVCQWLCALLAEGRVVGNILVCGQTIPFLRNGCAAYLSTLAPQYGLTVKDGGLKIEGERGCIVLQSFEKPERVLSAQWALVFVNEGNVIPQSIVDGLAIRCGGLLLADFNPSVNDWWGKSLISPSNSLFCSFKDNPYLGDSQLAAIERIRERGESAPVGSYANWYYRVYYLGEFAEAGGGVFTQVCRGNEWEAVDAPSFWGADWGDTSDPNAVVELRVTDGGETLHVRRVLYQTGLSDEQVCAVLKSANVSSLVFETATGGNTRAKNLRAFGFGGKLIPCVKERVEQGVFNISSKKIVCYDDDTFSEFLTYRLDGGKFKGADHLIDATRYVASLVLTNRLR